MFKSKQLLLIILVLLNSGFIFAQRDTLFWFAAPDVSSAVGQTPVKLRIQSYDNPATITVSQPANGSFVPITLTMPAFQCDSIDLTPFLAQIESPAANVVSNNGLRIRSTSKINVTYELNATSNKEVFSLKGTRALGTDFYTPFQKDYANGTTSPVSYSGFEIVATTNGTTVLITPRTAITGHAADVTYSITLNAGQTYSARDVSSTAATSLAGSIISSNQPVAVTIFDGQLIQGSCADAIGDQLVSSTYIGTDYAVYRNPSNQDKIYILGVQNSTSLTITGASTTNAVIASGETFSFSMTDDIMSIHSTKPIYVLQVSSFGCELSSAIVPSLNCKGNNQMKFSRSSSDSLGVVLITRSGFENNFLLNGSSSLITGAMFNPVPGTSGQYVAARIFFNTAEVGVNSNNMIANFADIFTMGVINGSSNSGSSFAYTTDFYATAYADAGPDDTVCANVDISLYSSVGGGAITGSWSSNGYGTFTNGLNSVPNTYEPSPLDTLISPIRLILSTTGYCPVAKDTMYLMVTPAPIVNANVDQSICSNNSTIQLNGLISGGSTSGFWSSNGTGTFSPNVNQLNAIYVPSAADIALGNITFVLTSNNSSSCAVATDTMHVVFTPAAVVNSGADTITVCANNASVSLNGSVTGPTTTGKWTSSGNGIFSPNNSTLNATYIPSAADTAAGQIMLYLESTSNGNCNVVFDSVLVIISNAPKVNAGPNQLICSNDATIQLAGSVIGGAFTGVWSGGTGTFSPGNTSLTGSYSPSATELANGSLVLTLTSANNGTCNAVSDAVQFNFVAPPFANFNSTTVCFGNSTQLTDFSLPGSGTITGWSWDLGQSTTSNVQNPIITYNQAGTIPVTLIVSNSNGCSDTLTNNVVVHDKPVANFSYTLACPNNQLVASFTDISTSSDPINSYFYDFGGQGTANLADVSNTFNQGGNYSVTHIVTTSFGCKDTLVSNVQIDDLPNAGFYYNTNGGLNVGAIFNFIDTSSNAVSYSWSFGDGNTSNTQNTSHTYYANGNYIITLYATNNLGCMDSTNQLISINTVTNEIYTLIPTVISPNGDGLNDVWELDFIPLLYPNASVDIFNEWGQQLFSSEGYTSPWDGTYNGSDVPDGSYFYVIRLNADVSPDIYKGVLTILRKRG